jgi:hypothetical protein
LWPVGLLTAVLARAACGGDVIVPGRGVQITTVGDDFEDPAWYYDHQGDKSSRDLDNQPRLPGGESSNRRWYEGAKHGHPDVVTRLSTPPDGLPGSEGALLLRSLRSGIPGRVTNQVQQDDFVADVRYRVGQPIPVSLCPSVLVRVFFPPMDEWEARAGPHFAFRCTVDLEDRGKLKTHWPGMFVVREDVARGRNAPPHFRIRANRQGEDYPSRSITALGWWTLGMSLTPDGRLHYFARPGVGHLTLEDRIASDQPYGLPCRQLKTFFFSVCNLDNGRQWSTPCIIDEAAVYYVPTLTVSAPKSASR